MITNKKAQAGEISMGIAALGFIVLLGILAFFFFIVLRGNVIKESTLPFSQGEYELSTTSYLSNVLSTRDDYGIKYSDLIQNAIAFPSSLHPSGKTYAVYYVDAVNDDICKSLDARFFDRYFFFVENNGNRQYSCGVEPVSAKTFSESQLLPAKDGEIIKITLVTWSA